MLYSKILRAKVTKKFHKKIAIQHYSRDGCNLRCNHKDFSFDFIWKFCTYNTKWLAFQYTVAIVMMKCSPTQDILHALWRICGGNTDTDIKVHSLHCIMFPIHIPSLQYDKMFGNMQPGLTWKNLQPFQNVNLFVFCPTISSSDFKWCTEHIKALN
jgi:hypothetical protein